MRTIINMLINTMEYIVAIAGLVAVATLIYANIVGLVLLARVSAGAVVLAMLTLIDLLYVGN